MEYVYLLEKRSYICDKKGNVIKTENEILSVCTDLGNIKNAITCSLKNNTASEHPALFWITRMILNEYNKNESRLIQEGDLENMSNLFPD